MVRELIIDAGTNETRVALLEDGELAELLIEKPYPESIVGNIYRGKVSNVLPGMQAAFIDIGICKNAFLHAGDVLYRNKSEDDEGDFTLNSYNSKIENLLKPGQEITVQVIKDLIGTKGPRVTMNITIPGRYLVLVPGDNDSGVSRRVEDISEKQRLKTMIQELKPEGMSLIARTAAEGRDKSELEADCRYLLKLWDKISKQEEKGQVPRILYKDLNLIYRVIRDIFTEDMKKLVVNNSVEYEKILEFMELISPSMKLKVEHYQKEYDLFEYYQLESSIARALSRKIWLKSGGYLVIDQTEALTVVDVNTGKYIGKRNLEDTVVKTNLEAADEIAKQLRIRDIGGIIICDFIDMKEEEHQSMVIDKLRSALKNDRTKTMVVGITGLGLVEMTRKKVHKSLSSVMKKSCPVCGGTGSVLSAESILRNIEKRISASSFSVKGDMRLEMNPALVTMFKSDSGLLRRLQDICERKLELVADRDIDYGDIRIATSDEHSDE